MKKLSELDKRQKFAVLYAAVIAPANKKKKEKREEQHKRYRNALRK